MISNVGMNPYGAGGTIVSPGSQPSQREPGQESPDAAKGEAAAVPPASRVAPEAIDPPEQAARTDQPRPEPPQSETVPAPVALTTSGARFTLIEPPMEMPAPSPSDTDDAEGPVGPPPAFPVSPLEARRNETASPDPDPAVISAPESVETTPDAAPADVDATDPPATPSEEPDASASTDAPEAAALDTLAPANEPGDVFPGPSLTSGTSPASDDPLRDAIRRVLAETAPLDVPPEPEIKAEAGFADVQRMETPYDSATVDVTR